MTTCDCPDPTRCVHFANLAAEWAGEQRRAEEPYRLRIAQEAGEAEAARRATPGYAEGVAIERAKLDAAIRAARIRTEEE